MNPKSYVLILVFPCLLQLCTSESRNDKIYIIPTSSVLSCPTNYSCMTIAQCFGSLLDIVDQSNSSMTLYFLPGKHILETRTYLMTNVSNIQLVGLPSSERNVDIVYNGDGTILFDRVKMLRLEALHFISQKGKMCTIIISNSHVCETIDIVSVNASIYLYYVTSLIVENVVITNAISRRTMMNIEKCTGLITNFTIENNIATSIGTFSVTIYIFNSALHIKGSMYVVNNTGTLHTSLILMKNTFLQISAHMVFTDNTKFSSLWESFYSYTKFQRGELTIYHNLDMFNILMLAHCTFVTEQQTKINVSDNNCQDVIIDIFYSILEVYGIMNFYGNHAQDLLSMLTNSGLTLAGNASFVNNINTGLISVRGNVIFINESFLYTNATVVFANNTGCTGSGIGAYQSNILIFKGTTMFMNNSATYEGGAIYMLQFNTSPSQNMSIHFQGLTIFAGNSAVTGGAIYCQGENITISFTGNTIFAGNSAVTGGAIYCQGENITIISFTGNTIFTGNRAKTYGAHLVILSNYSCYAHFSGNTTLESGRSLLGGPITAIGNVSIVFSGVNIFARNSVKSQIGNIQIAKGAEFRCYGQNIFTRNKGGVFIFQVNATFTISGVTHFNNNFSPSFYGAGAIYMINSSGIMQGYISFVNNTAPKSPYGAIGIISSRLAFEGNILFLANSAKDGAAMTTYFNSNVNFMGNITLTLNRVHKDGGAIVCVRSSMLFQGYSNFKRNKARGYSGAIHAANCKISLKGEHVFNSNKASYGGALSLVSDSRITLASVELVFINNSAEFGGAMYTEDTMNSRDCMDDATLLTNPLNVLFRSECFFHTDTVNSSEIKADGNYATNQGDILLGGKLNRCTVNGKSGDKTFPRLFDNSVIAGTSITSQPYRLCFCSSHDKRPDCEIESFQIRATRGELFTITVAALDQLNHAVFSIVRAELPEDSNKTSRLGAFDSIQTVNAMCTELRYRIFSIGEIEDIIIYAEGPCGKMGSASRTISVTFLPCPDGFQLYGDQCLCSSQLQQYASNTTHCDVDGQLIIKSGNFWMGALYRNGSYIGLLLYSHCPFNYCKQSTVNFTLNDSNAQCNFNRSGILCGECKFNYSLVLGGSMCSICSNDYIALTLVFILAGVVLVVVLILLKLTVATGMVNGLIFYANVVTLNKDILFPPGKPNWLKIFISWINLDLGIQVCFYDGMDTYVHTWLQFLFPFYLWMLVGAIIFISHRSTTITKWLGSNPVAVLSTIFLLSYMKLLRTITTIFYFAEIEHPDRAKKVWLYDGNIDYLQGKHIPLFIFALVMFLIFFLPFNFLLLCSPYLQRISGRMYRSQIKSSLYKVFVGWYDDYRIQAFMDAYNAPYNLEYRYWTGLFLLVRCTLFLAFAINALGNSSTNMLAIATATLGLLVLTRLFINGKVYKNWFTDAFETFFLLNLGILSLATNHNNLVGGNQEILVNITVGSAFAMFVAIILYHAYKQLKGNSVLKAIFSKHGLLKFIKMNIATLNTDHTQLHDRLLQSNTELQPSTIAPTTSVISMSECQDSTTG